MRERMHTIAIIARHEFWAALRARLVLVFALVCALLSLVIALAGLGASGQLLVQGFTRTAASLLNIAIYLLPLVGLIIGAATIGNDDSGTELLLSQPIARFDALLGRVLGLCAVVWSIALAGFGATALLVLFTAGTSGFSGYALVVGAALATGSAGLALGVFLGVLCGSRSAAVGWALATWFVLAVGYDLVAIMMLQLVGDGQPGRVLLLLLALNPIDGLRALSLVWLGADVLLGPTGTALAQLLRPARAVALVLASALLAFALPLGLASLVYKRRDF